MKIQLNKQSLFLILLTTAFAAIYSWIEYYILVGIVQEVIYTKILFWISYLIVAFAFTTINSYAGFACFSSGLLTEDFLYRFFAQTNYLDIKYMIGALAIVLILVARSMIIIDTDKQKFDIPKVPESTYKEEPIVIPKKEIDEIKTDTNFKDYQPITPDMKTEEVVGVPVIVDVGKEEKFDPKKEEMKKRVKERFLKKQKEKYNGK